jgi:hypothetical protein
MCVCIIALVIQHAKRMRHVVICGLSASDIFSHVMLQKTPFLEKEIIEYKMCVLISSTFFI